MSIFRQPLARSVPLLEATNQDKTDEGKRGTGIESSDRQQRQFLGVVVKSNMDLRMSMSLGGFLWKEDHHGDICCQHYW